MFMVMKREEDNTIIVVVTVEGVKVGEPGFKGYEHCYVPGYSARGGPFPKLRGKYARDPPCRANFTQRQMGNCPLPQRRVHRDHDFMEHHGVHFGFAGAFVICCVCQQVL